MTLGLIFPEVRLSKYTPEWADAFKAERDRIRQALKDQILDIEHVGSTAVPGISAKPIIDIVIAVRDLRLADQFSPDLVRIGYDDAGDGGIPGHRVFGRGPRIRTHLVHVVIAGGRDWQDYLAFREALRSDEALAEHYDSLKRSLAAKYPDDRRSYTSAKGEFVQQVLSRVAV